MPSNSDFGNFYYYMLAVDAILTVAGGDDWVGKSLGLWKQLLRKF